MQDNTLGNTASFYAMDIVTTPACTVQPDGAKESLIFHLHLLGVSVASNPDHCRSLAFHCSYCSGYSGPPAAPSPPFRPLPESGIWLSILENTSVIAGSMVRVYDVMMPSEAIELLREPVEALSFLQLCLLGFWVLGVAARRGMDVVIEFVFVRLLKSVLAGEGRKCGQSYEVRENAVAGRTEVKMRETGRSFPSTGTVATISGNARHTKVYAVRRGCNPGLYFTWAECEEQVKGFPGARYKGFRSWSEANAWFHCKDS